MAVNQVPVIAGFHPDPTICRAGDDYYVACSSFEYFPGIPILHSRDLRTWKLIGNAITRTSQFDPTGTTPSRGIFAPTLRHHAGRFYLTVTDVNRMMNGQMIMQADSPDGPWSDPVFVPGTPGVDPDLAWDSDGNCYLTYSGYPIAGSLGGIVQLRIDPDTGTVLSDPYQVWQGTGGAFPEAPHLYEIDGTWYLLLAEGGTERGHTSTIARGPAPHGPFEPCPDNPILTHRSTAHPVQNAGHADFVQAPDGTWYAVHLGVRARGQSPAFHVLGRETFLTRVDWKDGWPVVQDLDEQVTVADHSFTDDFTAPALHHRWVSPGADPASVLAGGALTTSGLLCVRVRDERWTAEVTVDGPARFVLRLDDRHWYALISDGEQISAVSRVGDIEHTVASIAVPQGTTTLRIEAVTPAAAAQPGADTGPDEIVLAAEGQPLARLDGRYLSTEVAGGFTGRVLGVGAVDDTAQLRRFAYTANH